MKIGTHRLILHVNLVSGKTHDHIIELPDVVAEAEKTATFYLTKIEQAIVGRRKKLILYEPFVIYNAKSIVSVEGEFIAPDDWKKMINNSLRKPGFYLKRE